MLKQEFQYYLDNQENFVKSYNGKVLVIKNQSVVGVYDSEYDALEDAPKKHELGTFLIQRCTPGNEAYTQKFHSRVIFA